MDFSIILKEPTTTEIELPITDITVDSGTLPFVLLEGGIKFNVDEWDTLDYISLEIDSASQAYWQWSDYKGDWESSVMHLARGVFTNDYTPIYLKLINTGFTTNNLTIDIKAVKKIDEC